MLCNEGSKQYDHRVALFGMGGVGKTQIAIEYVLTHTDMYMAVFWISAVSQADLFSGFQNIAREIGCPNIDLEQVTNQVLRWFKQQTGWLLVLDNLDDITIVDPYLPDISCSGHVLITMRDPNATGIPAQGLKVEVFAEEEATELLLHRADLADNPSERVQTEAARIVTELGFLALAVEQAAAYIRVQLKDIFKFLGVYKEHRKLFLVNVQDRLGTILKRSQRHGCCHLQQSSRTIPMLNYCCICSPF